ncbi:MAG: tRNA pseudouridine(55) synthase TruB [Magnetococcales bacterium]|nr:tRNA pseudouridine(55) synthase TruB [Magnetococcales bacterium]
MSGGRRRRGTPIHGWLPIFKEPGMSSFQVVKAVRHITGAAKAGHGGTLDPFAEGVLPIALGHATKVISLILEGDKSYRCQVQFGRETDTGDLEGATVAQSDQHPEREQIEAALPSFTGEIDQIPPIYSAIHVNGQRAYELARKGVKVALEPRKVTIYALSLDQYGQGVAQLTVRCSKGTYIRSLARDLGQYLGCGAHLSALVRIQTLGFGEQDAFPLDRLREAVQETRLHTLLKPIDAMLDDIPVLHLDSKAWHKLRHGQIIDLTETTASAGPVRFYDPDGRFVGLGEVKNRTEAEGVIQCHPRRIMES